MAYAQAEQTVAPDAGRRAAARVALEFAVLKDCASGKRRERRVDLQGFFRSMASERGLQRLAKNAVS
ncbi:hypothetical protein [Acidovorax sp.]|uniref:hypothetical protein n=1 Tax=Acidovorax sp. TaxID=1872122 RepID=UPI002605EE26|nr:hypothetical protein [Acidovorax sp.]HQT19315.1 hypothetical protein [Acidovorax defluvii]HQT51352.1 hypothetical protein [Acidovorax defluvii]